MENALEGAWLKVERATEHARHLECEVADFRKLDSDNWAGEYDSDSGEYVFRVTKPKVAKPEWGPLIGDIAHNARSALDHVAWQLALRSHGVPDPKHVHFPLAENSNDFKSERHGGLGQQITDPCYWTVLERCQPYNRVQGDSLRALHFLWLMDKHREVQMAAVTFAPASHEIEFHVHTPATTTITGPPRWCDERPDMGAELARLPVRVEGENPHIEMKGEFPLYVAFDEGEPTVSGQPVDVLSNLFVDSVGDVLMHFVGLEPDFLLKAF